MFRLPATLFMLFREMLESRVFENILDPEELGEGEPGPGL